MKSWLNFIARSVKSEGRHFEDYLLLAQQQTNASIDERIAFFVAREAELITSPDTAFRFHSGVPA